LFPTIRLFDSFRIFRVVDAPVVRHPATACGGRILKKQAVYPVGDWFPPQEQEGVVDRETYRKRSGRKLFLCSPLFLMGKRTEKEG
jgi:hypothetical protein